MPSPHDPKASLMRGRTIRRLLATTEAWRNLSKHARESAIADLHNARQVESDLGLENNAEACSKLIHMAEAIADADHETYDEISAAFRKAYG